MGSSDSETEFKKKKDKKDKDKDKDEKKKDKGKDKDKDKGKDKDKDKDEKKKEKDKDEKKGDKDKDGKKDKKEKDGDKHKDEKKKDKGKDKDKKDKKDKKGKKGDDEDEDEDDEDDEDDGKKKKKDKDKEKHSHPPGHGGVSVSGGEAASYYNPSGTPPSQPAHPSKSGEVPWFLREPGTEPIQDQRPPRTGPDFPDPNPHHSFQQPARAVGDVGGGQSVQNVPPSGHRIPLDPNAQFPSPDQLGRPPATDSDGSTPVFVGSAIFPDSVQPCKIVPSLYPPCRISHGGSEVAHHGRYDLLPITQNMEWVPTGNGQIPPGRRPVEGGYESNGGKLYHALGSIQGVHVPGKAGEHLRGANVALGGSEYNLQTNYSILCWR